MAFGICHFLLLLWLCDDRHAGKADVHAGARSSQPHALAHLRFERGRRVWIALQSFVSVTRRSKGRDEPTGVFPALGALLAPLFLLLVSNLEGFFESLHSKGIGWDFNSATSPFWSWLDLNIINKTPPTLPLKWMPTEFFWWWRASRVIMDYDLTGKWMGDIIDEFPFFSYLLGDLHPHVLAMPFNLLAIAVALNIFLGGWRGKIDLFFGQLQISKTGFFIIALVLGGLAFLNTWDILLGVALIVFSYALAQVRESGWGWERIEDILLLGIPAGITAFVIYLPFFVGFDFTSRGHPAEFYVRDTRHASVDHVGHVVRSAFCVSDLFMAEQNTRELACWDFHLVRYCGCTHRDDVRHRLYGGQT